MSNWLDNLVEQYSEMETPTNFWRWAGLVTISAIMRDQVWLSRGGAYDLFPNIYCILYADSGLKKGPATNLAKKLVKEVNSTKIISGRSSIQGIMKKLSSQSQSYPGGKVTSSRSHGFIISSELSASLVSDPAALDILTDLYDRNYNADDWESLLKMEEFKLRDPTITLFGGINAAHADNFFGKKDISGGFLARSFIIHETEEHTINSLVKRLTNPPDIKKISLYLKELVKLTGPFKELSNEFNEPTEVGEYYDDWYNGFRAVLKTQKIKDETGTLNRFGDSVLKVAMLLSLSRNPVLEIDMESLIESIQICEKFIGGVRHATLKKTGNDATNAERKTLLMQELLQRDNHKISRTQLNKKYWLQGNDKEWDEVCISMVSAGYLTIDSVGNQVVISMTDDTVKEMEKYFKGKMK